MYPALRGRRRIVEQLKDENAALKANQGQEVEAVADIGVLGIKALKKVVERLTPHDKIVHVYFDEVYTNRKTVYNRAEDRMLGCGLTLKGRKTVEYIAVLVFAVRSLLTAFNILLSATPTTIHKGDANELEPNCGGDWLRCWNCRLWQIGGQQGKKEKIFQRSV